MKIYLFLAKLWKYINDVYFETASMESIFLEKHSSIALFKDEVMVVYGQIKRMHVYTFSKPLRGQKWFSKSKRRIFLQVLFPTKKPRTPPFSFEQVKCGTPHTLFTLIGHSFSAVGPITNELRSFFYYYIFF